jgi:hypothetical protein
MRSTPFALPAALVTTVRDARSIAVLPVLVAAAFPA